MNHGRIIAEGPPLRLTAQIRQAESYLLRLARPGDGVVATLKQLPNVIGVQQRQRGTYLVDTRLGTDPREQLAKTVVEHGWGLLELSPLELTLEDVFQALTRKESAA